MSEKSVFSHRGDENKVQLRGIIEEESVYSHSLGEMDFYMTRVIVKRLSGTEDLVPVMFSKAIISKYADDTLKGKHVVIDGKIRRYNKLGDDGCHHLITFVLVDYIYVVRDKDEEMEDDNWVFLEGCVSKTPLLRKTPLGRGIADLVIAVKRNNGTVDYVPCIAWDRVAEYAYVSLNRGDKVRLQGRLQSREYLKWIPYVEGELYEKRISYEVSITRIGKIRDDEF